MSQYTVEEVTTREYLDSIANVIWAAMDGVDPSHKVFFPVFGSQPADRETAIEASKERTWEDHNSDPSSHWIFVRQRTSGNILGGCQWRIYTENPFPNGTPEIKAVWWPEGEGRHFATEVVRQCYTPRTRWMPRPHVGKYVSNSKRVKRRTSGDIARLEPDVCPSPVPTIRYWTSTDGMGPRKSR